MAVVDSREYPRLSWARRGGRRCITPRAAALFAPFSLFAELSPVPSRPGSSALAPALHQSSLPWTTPVERHALHASETAPADAAFAAQLHTCTLRCVSDYGSSARTESHATPAWNLIGRHPLGLHTSSGAARGRARQRLPLALKLAASREVGGTSQNSSGGWSSASVPTLSLGAGRNRRTRRAGRYSFPQMQKRWRPLLRAQKQHWSERRSLPARPICTAAAPRRLHCGLVTLQLAAGVTGFR